MLRTFQKQYIYVTSVKLQNKWMYSGSKDERDHVYFVLLNCNIYIYTHIIYSHGKNY